MKKLMTLMVGMMFVLGATAVFAQDAPKTEQKTEKKASKKKGGKKKTEEKKTEQK